MVQVQRTSAQLIAAFLDNDQGLIVPDLVRDLLESMKPSVGCIHVTTPAATTVATADVFVKAAGATVDDYLARFTESDNRLTYAGAVTIEVLLFATLSVLSAGTQIVSSFAFAKNGEVIAGTAIDRKITTGTDVGAMAMLGIVSLAPGDYVEMWLTNRTNTSSITLNKMVMLATGFFT